MGKIYDIAREQLPVTWDVLANTSRYGTSLLNSKIEFIKYKLFSTVVNPTMEESTYDILTLNYAAKEVALQVIPTALDYWREVVQSKSLTGTQENVSYTDRVNALKELQYNLEKEVSELQFLLGPNIIKAKRKIITPKGNETDFVSADPNEFPDQWGSGISTNLPWGPPSL